MIRNLCSRNQVGFVVHNSKERRYNCLLLKHLKQFLRCARDSGVIDIG